ncbi:calcium-binding protein [Mameliella alba]|uniref:calcium-binding protein n=1 Tax=Mameliella alba TaxID=561184 RepID=UPI000B53669C|nr:calcium-binding protein [Mameliella alba]MBY6122240.1 calcium-binding protein [Mameliella alba]OWV39762.1 hypothetical protein CDZ95_24165 [Mameliella alba]OWV55648.1 hypothetical protein CDZ97_22925 [Mameliella alba]
MPTNLADNETGDFLANLVSMLDGDDTYIGKGGNDTIQGGAGADFLLGNDGHDQIFGADGNDTLVGDTGNDTLLGGANRDVLRGNADNDFLDGGSHRDLLVGGPGDDTLLGGRGNDVLQGDEGADVFRFDTFDGVDVIRDFENGTDLIDLKAFGALDITSFDDLVLNQNGSSAVIFFGSDTKIILQDTSIAELDADDFIFGTRIGADNNLPGTSGGDHLVGRRGRDEIFGEGGHDTLVGQAGDDTLLGGAGNDTLLGNADNDLLYGGLDADHLNGGPGDDTLDGGQGNDVLQGDIGADVFRFAISDGVDVVRDFEDGTDKIDLTAYGHLGITSVDDLTITQNNAHAVIYFDSDNKIILCNMDAADLDAGDFIFGTGTETLDFDSGLFQYDATANQFTYEQGGFVVDGALNMGLGVSGQIGLIDLDGDCEFELGLADTDFGTGRSDSITIDIGSQVTGKSFDLVGFDLDAFYLDGSDNTISLRSGAPGAGSVATFNEDGDGLWDIDGGPEDLTFDQMLPYFEDMESLHITITLDDMGDSADLGGGLGIDNIVLQYDDVLAIV